MSNITKKNKINTNIKQVKKTKMMEIGEKEYVDPATGEVVTVTLIKKNIHTDYNFHKVWIQDLLNILNSFGNKKIKILSYLLGKMMNENNIVYTTYEKIANDTGISYFTISATMRELIEADVLRKIQTGVYQFNPALIVRGGSGKRQMLMVEYLGIDDAKKLEDFYDDKNEIENEIEIKGEIINE